MPSPLEVRVPDPVPKEMPREGRGPGAGTVGQARTEAPVQRVIQGHREETWETS